MNTYEPKQRIGDKKWDYTRNNYPTGYCAEYREIDTEVIPVSESQLAEWRETSHKHHTEGHETEAEACECYKQYILDHHLRLNLKMSDEQRKCEVCQAWTQSYADAQMRIFTLCDKHNNRETVESLYPPPSTSWSSW